MVPALSSDFGQAGARVATVAGIGILAVAVSSACASW